MAASLTEINRHEQSLLLLRGLLRALSHQIRTPLSVISNDLSYFKTIIGEQECSRSIERCREISDILKSACEITRLNLERCSVAEVLGLLNLGGQIDRPATIWADRHALAQIFSYIRQLEPNALFNAELGALGCLSILIQVDPAQPPKVPAVAKIISFTEYYTNLLDRDLLSPPLIDATLWAHGAQTKISVDSKLIIAIEFNLVV